MNIKETPTDIGFEPLLDLKMNMATFTADWLHCDQCSNYVARMVSHDRRDPIRHANLLSSALNELLEMSFHSNEDDGEFVYRFYRYRETERIELTFPCSPQKRRFYHEIVQELQGEHALASYLDVIANDAAPADRAILFGLAVNYDADIKARDLGTSALTFIVDLPLERLLN
ncbi:ubiquinone biosynthesis methyltransferase UbiE [Agrobacterium rhizogenes]|uniref:ubiquinone biosynthesis methyltransferase UbiE n=1 Tax=Rhizobium rhizogenes TaxID=359 RepID=UPI0015727D53|nr:ubiquinone biosynthesis methyltransferase UbiE [Rhizobium rhizogenes]NTG51513.1 ubiquinone biosynthesis methyltransferase UbiE [Rhizobium rhizogenes]